MIHRQRFVQLRILGLSLRQEHPGNAVGPQVVLELVVVYVTLVAQRTFRPVARVSPHVSSQVVVPARLVATDLTPEHLGRGGEAVKHVSLRNAAATSLA